MTEQHHLRYSDTEHLLLTRLAAVPPSSDGRLTDLEELLVDVNPPVRHEWVLECARDLDERGFIQASLATEGEASAKILPAGLEYAEQARGDATIVESPADWSARPRTPPP